MNTEKLDHVLRRYTIIWTGGYVLRGISKDPGTCGLEKTEGVSDAWLFSNV